MLIAIFINVSRWRTRVRRLEDSIHISKCATNCYICDDDGFIYPTLGGDRIKLEERAEKLKAVERRSLRIVQVRAEKEDDNL